MADVTDQGGDAERSRAELERLRVRVLELEAKLAGDRRGPPHRPESFGLEAREQLLSEAERMAHVGSFAWHVPSDSIHWSDELYRILGYVKGETVPSQEAFFAAIHPDDRQHVKDVAARSVANGVGDECYFRIVRPDGTVRHARMNGSPLFDSDGRPARFVGAVLDQTDRVAAEAEMRRREEVLKHAQRIAKVGSFEWDPWSGVTVWSDELYQICGVSREEGGTFERYFALVHPDDRQPLLDAAANVTPDVRIGPHEYRIVRPDGTIVHVYAEASPVSSADGSPRGFIGTVLDITHLKRLEAQLLQSQKMEALGRLAGGVAHDFNNLLTVIGVHVDLLRRRRDERELTEVAGAVERAGQLTRQLLAFSRQSVFELRRIDPVRNVRDSLRMMNRIVGEDVQISFRAASLVGAVAVDPSQLEQVLLNLVVNARDALPRGGHVEVTVERVRIDTPPDDAQPSLAPGEYVVLEVSDDGVGMDETVRSRALEPFFTTKEPGRGTGLGLAMVFGIASQLGGAVALSSARGKGTRVRVYLPAAEAGDAAKEDAASAGASPTGGGELLLLIDDDRTLGRLLGEVLESAGYRVERASSGSAALAFFEKHRSEVTAVVTDVVMPEMGGPELVRRLRAQTPDLPVLYLSGYARENPDEDEDPATRGAFLMKPFSPSALVDRVAEVVASRRAG